MALDLRRGYILKAEFSHAIDAVGLTDWDPLDVGLDPEDIVRFFDVNFPPGHMGAVLTGDGPSLIVNEHDNTITIEAKATIPTQFMSLAGVDEVTAVARSVIER